MIDLIEHLLLSELKLSHDMIDGLFSVFEDYGVVSWATDTVLMIEFLDLILLEVKSTQSDYILHWVNLTEGVKHLAENYNYGEF